MQTDFLFWLWSECTVAHHDWILRLQCWPEWWKEHVNTTIFQVSIIIKCFYNVESKHSHSRDSSSSLIMYIVHLFFCILDFHISKIFQQSRNFFSFSIFNSLISFFQDFLSFEKVCQFGYMRNNFVQCFYFFFIFFSSPPPSHSPLALLVVCKCSDVI